MPQGISDVSVRPASQWVLLETDGLSNDGGRVDRGGSPLSHLIDQTTDGYSPYPGPDRPFTPKPLGRLPDRHEGVLDRHVDKIGVGTTGLKPTGYPDGVAPVEERERDPVPRDIRAIRASSSPRGSLIVWSVVSAAGSGSFSVWSHYPSASTRQN